MAENAYEGMFILDSNRYARDPAGTATQIAEMITKLGGSMLVSRLWEERRLAYPIAGHRKGTYWLTYFRLDSSKLATLNRESHLNESIIRSLVLKIDPRIVDTLVAHAQASPADLARAKRAEPAPVAAPAGVDVPEIEDDLGN